MKEGEGPDAISNPGTRLFFAIFAGVVLGQVASRITQYYTSSEYKPVKDIASLEKQVLQLLFFPEFLLVLNLQFGHSSQSVEQLVLQFRLGGGNTSFSFYLVALTGIGMLSTTAIVVAEDTFGPVADNAQGIAEMSGVFEGETEEILDGLDTVGNTTKAVTKGFAIGSAVIAAVALFASFVETIFENGQDKYPSCWCCKLKQEKTAFEAVQFNVADPKTFIGLLIGGSVAFMFSSLAILGGVSNSRNNCSSCS
jgi:K(+)-stimulated pyrophosphate-energized sodium pump